MNKWIRSGVILLAVVGLMVPSAALAAEEGPEGRFRVVGELTAINLEEATIELESLRGEPWTVHITGETKFRSANGEVAGLEDLAREMTIFAAGAWLEGEAIADVVALAREDALRDLGRARGEVTEVDVRDQTFRLETRQGDVLRFLVTESTKFHSRGTEVEGLEDVEPGWHAMVIYRETDRGLAALRVAVGVPPTDRPRIDIRARGQIVELSDVALTLAHRNGEETTFQLTDDTIIRAPGDGLSEGMRAMVAAQETEEGRPVAVLVAAFRGRQHGADRGAFFQRGQPPLAPPVAGP